MSTPEQRCCILGGCGCSPGSLAQKDALALLIVEEIGVKKDVALRLADRLLEVFGTGPHTDQINALGMPEAETQETQE